MTDIEVLYKVPSWSLIRLYYNGSEVVEDLASTILTSDIQLGKQVNSIVPVDDRTIQLNTTD